MAHWLSYATFAVKVTQLTTFDASLTRSELKQHSCHLDLEVLRPLCNHSGALYPEDSIQILPQCPEPGDPDLPFLFPSFLGVLYAFSCLLQTHTLHSMSPTARHPT